MSGEGDAQAQLEGATPLSAESAAQAWLAKAAGHGEAEAPPYVWLFEAPGASGAAAPSGAAGGAAPGWQPFRLGDARRLERVLARSRRPPKPVADVPSPQKGTLVPVYCGRYDVDLDRRMLRAAYWEEPERRVLRSLWFHGHADERIPYEEDECEQLEEAYARLRAGEVRAPLLMPVNRGRHDVRFDAAPQEDAEAWSYASWALGASAGATAARYLGIDAAEPGAEASPRFTVVQESVDRSGGRMSVPVWRGFYVVGEDQAESSEEALPSRVEVLVFVAPGGAKQTAGEGFHAEVARVREIAVRRMVQRSREGLAVPGRIEFLPLEWCETARIDEGVAQKLQSVTLSSAAALRAFAGDAIADVLVYQDDEWHHRIHDELIAKMGRMYSLFRQRTLNFGGEVAVVGHALGSVVVFDLVQRVLPATSRGLATWEGGEEGEVPARGGAAEARRGGGLAIVSEGCEEPEEERCPPPRCVFAVGSPLGLLLSVRLSRRGQRPAAHFRGLDVRWPMAQRGCGWRLFNVYHPEDPRAYRLEPLLNPEYAAIAPKVVPHQGGLRFHRQVRDWLHSVAAPVAAAGAEQPGDVLLVRSHCAQREPPPELAKAETGCRGSLASTASAPTCVAADRIDFVLQESAFESLSEAFQSDRAYWESEDFVDFVVDQVFDVCARRSPAVAAPEAPHAAK